MLDGHGVRLEPLAPEHAPARADGRVVGSARDTVLYSILAHEWPDVRRYHELRLVRHATRTEKLHSWAIWK